MEKTQSSGLKAKSIVQLRAIAQGEGIPDIFQKTDIQLIQAIELKQTERIPESVVVFAKPEYDARLMSKPPAKISSEEELTKLLQPLVERGLHLSFPEPERFHIKWGKKEDSGNMRQPLRAIIGCAERLLR